MTDQRYRLGFTATGNATARAWFGGLKHYKLLYCGAWLTEAPGSPRLAAAEKQNCFSPLPSEASGTDRFLALPPGPSRGPPGDRTEAKPLSYGAAVG